MLNSPATLDFSSFEGKENDPPSFNWIKKASARIPQFLVERHAMAVISVYLLCPQGEGEKEFKRDAWLRLRLKEKRAWLVNSWPSVGRDLAPGVYVTRESRSQGDRFKIAPFKFMMCEMFFKVHVTREFFLNLCVKRDQDPPLYRMLKLLYELSIHCDLVTFWLVKIHAKLTLKKLACTAGVLLLGQANFLSSRSFIRPAMLDLE